MTGFSSPIRWQTPDIRSKLLPRRAGNRRYREGPCQRSGITSPNIEILVLTFWAPPQAAASGLVRVLVPGRCATGCTGKLSSLGLSINVSAFSRVASFKCATQLHIPIALPHARPRSGSSSPCRQAASLASAAPRSCPMPVIYIAILNFLQGFSVPARKSADQLPRACRVGAGRIQNSFLKRRSALKGVAQDGNQLWREGPGRKVLEWAESDAVGLAEGSGDGAGFGHAHFGVVEDQGRDIARMGVAVATRCR